MKLLMNLLLWTTDMEDEMLPVLEKLKAMGFDGLEVPVFHTDVRQWQQWSRRLDKMGMTRVAVTFCRPEENPISPDPKVRQKGIDRLKAYVDCSQALGASLLTGPIHQGLNVFSGQPVTPQEWEWSVTSTRRVAEYAATAGVTLGVEYLNRFENYLLTCTDDNLRYVREVNHPNCGIMFDTFHAHIEEKNTADAFRRCAQHVVHIQVSENDRSTPGQGQVRWSNFFDVLKETNYQGSLAIEAFGRLLPDLAANLKIWRKMYENEDQLARDGLAFLRQEIERRKL